MKSETNVSSKLTRWIKAPIRVLSRARDMYIKSMTECSSRIDYGAPIGCPAAMVYTLPRSSSTHSTRREEDELRQLMRIVSMKEKAVDKTTVRTATVMTSVTKNAAGTTARKSKGLPKSLSLGIGRIDEDEPCYFQDDFKVGTKNPSVYSRSRSYAVGNRGSEMVLS